MKIRTCGSSWRSGSRNVCNFFGAIQMISCRDWRPWTKPGYVIMIRIQNNNQWSGGIAAHPAPQKNSEWKNLLENTSPRFFGFKTASSSLFMSRRAKLSTRSITYLCWCNWRTFWRKHAAGRSPRVLFLHDNAPAHRALATQKKLAYLGFHCVAHQPYSPVLVPSDSHLFHGLKKTTEMSPFFVQRGDHCCRGDQVERTNFWIAFEWPEKVRARGCIELRGEYVE